MNKTMNKKIQNDAGKYNITITLDKSWKKAIYRGINSVIEDVDSICERDPAAVGRLEVLLLYSGVHAVLLHRVAHAMQTKGWVLPARAVSQFGKFLTGIEIHPAAKIGKALLIDHGSGVVIGETAIIGDYCTIYQGVTLGGTGKETGKRHPTLGDYVMVGAGAKVLGNITIGSGSKVAAGAVVLSDVPENSTAVGIPAKVVRKDGEKVEKSDLDQVNIPDPVENELRAIRERMENVEKMLINLQNSKEIQNNSSEVSK